MKIGDRIQRRVDEAIHAHQKTLLILSASSMKSTWIELEVETALARELGKKTDMLFPIRLDNTVLESPTQWAGHIRETRHIGDFTQWQNEEGFKTGFHRLLRDLKQESGGTTNPC